MVRSLPKSGTVGAKGLKNSKGKKQSVAIPQLKRPLRTQRLATQRVSTEKQESSNTESSHNEVPKSRLVGAQNALTSNARKVTRGNKALHATKYSPTVQPDVHQDNPNLSAVAHSASSVPTKVTRRRAKGLLKSNIPDELSGSIPDGTSAKNTKNAPKKKPKAGTNDSVDTEDLNSSTKSQMRTVPVSNHNDVSAAKEQSSKTNVLQKSSKTPTRAPVLRRTRREKLPFDSDPAPVQETRRSKSTPKSDGSQSNSVSKKKQSVNRTSIHLKKKLDATKYIPSLKKKGRASKNPVLSTSTEEKLPQNVESDRSATLTKSVATSSISDEKLYNSKKLKTNHLKGATPKPLTLSNFNTPNENINSSVHPETLLANSVNLSLNLTKSPIIRTRKVNPKYADCVIPSKFSFVKQALAKTVTKSSSHHNSNNLAVSTPVPLVLVKDVTGLDKSNLEDAEEESSPTGTNKLPVSEAPDVGLDSGNRNVLVNMDLNSEDSKNTKGSKSVTRSQKNTTKTHQKNSEPLGNLASTVPSQKMVKSKNNVKINANTKDSVTNERTTPQSTSGSRLANKLSKAAKKTAENSITTIEATPNCVVKLSEFPIKLAVFRSPSQNTAANPDQFCENNAEQQTLALSSAATPRLSKRELLARALREGKLGKVTSATAIKKSDVKLNVPVLVKSTENAAKKQNSSVHENASSLETSEMVRDKKNNSAMNKKPIWAHAMSPTKKVKRLSSTRIKLPASNKSQAVFEFSFNSEDDKVQGKVQNVRKRAKITKPRRKIIKENLKSTRTKILTTDPNFEKEFPTTWDCRHGASRKPVATTSNQLQLDESFHADFDMHDDDFDMHGDDFDDLEPDIRPTGPVKKVLSNSNPEEARGLPSDDSEVISGNDVPGGQSKDKSHPNNSNIQMNSHQPGHNSIASENGNNDCEYLSRTPQSNKGEAINAGKASSSSNVPLPTPDATRLMSKLVGGTSTPFPAPNGCPVGASNGPSIPITLSATSSRAETRAEPITVSEQIKACFGFDESDDEVDANYGCEFTSLNLSPVHRENGSFCPLPHQYSVLSEAGNGSVRGLVSRNNSCQSNTSQGTFLRPTLASAATSQVLAAPNRISQGWSGNQRNFRILTKTVPIPGKSLLPQPLSHPSRQPVKVPSHSNNPDVQSKDTQSSTMCPVVSTTEEPGTSKTLADSVQAAKKDSATEQKDSEQSSSGTCRGRNNTVDSNAAAGSPVRANGALEKSRLFDDIDVSPAKINTPSKSPQADVHRSTATDSPIVSPEKSFSEPVRHAYDRRSLELSRRALQQTLAGGAPDQDDEAEMADQEDVSSAGAPRRRKRRGALVASRGRGRPAKQPTIVESFSAAATKLGTKNNGGNEENRRQTKTAAKNEGFVENGTQTRKGDAAAKPRGGVRTKRLRRDDVEGNSNKKAKSQQQPESILVADHKTGKAAKSVAFDESSEQSSINSSNASSTSGQVKKTKYSKKPTKAAAFEKSMNDWASDINSHFSEVEDLELVVM